MSNISSIKNEEVGEEVSNILALFSAVNAKINTIFRAEEIKLQTGDDNELPVLEMEQELIKPDRKSLPSKKSSSSINRRPLKKKG